MMREDLSPASQAAYDALPEDKREEFLLEQARARSQMIQGAVVQVMARNQSHNAGEHLCRK